jgi:TonB family protein
VRQDLPDWKIATSSARRFAGRFEGELDIVIDESGRVESATLVKSIFPAYNALAIAGSRNWQYTPATLGGVPVKYRKPVQISVVIPR